MGYYLDALGLVDIAESEEALFGLIAMVSQEGEAVIGYSGSPYLNLLLGDVRLIARTKLDTENKQIEVVGLDVHCESSCEWEAEFGVSELTPKDADLSVRRCLLRRKDGSGMAVVTVHNADVLPSFLPDEPVCLRMTAFPVILNYYKDEDEYAEAQPARRGGKKFLLGDGTIFPSGFLHNHAPERSEDEKNDEADDMVLIKGVVKEIRQGYLQFDGKMVPAFLRCLINTEFGPLEIVHTKEQVDPNQQNTVRPGAIVSGVFILTGNAAIHDYQKSFIADEQHLARLLRQTIVNGQIERLRYVLADNVALAISGQQHMGKEEVLAFLHSFCQGYTADTTWFATMQNHGASVRAVILAGESKNWETIIWFHLNEENRMIRIEIAPAADCTFIADPVREVNMLEVQIPDHAVESMFLRAQYHGLIPDGADISLLDSYPRRREYESVVWQLIGKLGGSKQIAPEVLENLFGFLYAKGVETALLESGKWGLFRKPPEVEYAITDIQSGTIHTQLNHANQQVAEQEMELGKQFYKDFSNFTVAYPERFEQELIDGLIAVQRIGSLYHERK